MMNNVITLNEIEPLDDPIFWVDIETTGLDASEDDVIEVAVVVTNGLWNVVDSYLQTFPLTYNGKKRLQNNEYVRNMHEKTGLLVQIERSEKKAFIKGGYQDLECFILAALERFEDDVKPLWAGSSVHFDKAFLEPYISSKVTDKFSHRIIDASAVREVARREDEWRLDLLDKIRDKDAEHRADFDILMSMKTLAISYGYSIPFLKSLPQDWEEVVSRAQAFAPDEDE